MEAALCEGYLPYGEQQSADFIPLLPTTAASKVKVSPTTFIIPRANLSF